MKHFIYLDTEALNSYLSQIDDGLLKNTVYEVVDKISSNQVEESTSGEVRFANELDINSLSNNRFSENNDVVSIINILSKIESGRELIEKMLHDNVFKQLRSYLHKEGIVSSINECNLGEYVELSERYVVRDLDYILDIYTEEFIEFICDNIIKEHERKRNKVKIEQNNIKRILSIARDIMPFSKFLLCDGCIIPLNDKFLRESTEKIRFSYSEKIKILGRYTSTLEEAVKRQENIQNYFDELYSSFYGTIKELYINVLGLDEKSKIIQPIALYFE